jgi:hypothetical protein
MAASILGPRIGRRSVLSDRSLPSLFDIRSLVDRRNHGRSHRGHIRVGDYPRWGISAGVFHVRLRIHTDVHMSVSFDDDLRQIRRREVIERVSIRSVLKYFFLQIHVPLGRKTHSAQPLQGRLRPHAFYTDHNHTDGFGVFLLARLRDFGIYHRSSEDLVNIVEFLPVAQVDHALGGSHEVMFVINHITVYFN